MKYKVTTILRGLLTPKTVILVLALYNFLVVWEETRIWAAGLSCFLCPWYAPWTFTNEPTRLLLAACGVCLSMRWGYLAAALSEYTLYQGASWYAYLLEKGWFIESWVKAWRSDLNPVLSLRAPVFVFDAAKIGPARAGLGGVRFGPGAGVRFELATVANFTVGYARNVSLLPPLEVGRRVHRAGVRLRHHHLRQRAGDVPALTRPRRAHPPFVRGSAPGAADSETTMAVFRRVRDEIKAWLNTFIRRQE